MIRSKRYSHNAWLQRGVYVFYLCMLSHLETSVLYDWPPSNQASLLRRVSLRAEAPNLRISRHRWCDRRPRADKFPLHLTCNLTIMIIGHTLYRPCAQLSNGIFSHNEVIVIMCGWWLQCVRCRLLVCLAEPKLLLRVLWRKSVREGRWRWCAGVLFCEASVLWLLFW